MPAGQRWTRAEVEVIIADYLDMFVAELSGREYSKAEHNRRLQRLLPDRNKSAIEFKHQNISAVLLNLGYAYIEGYKPAKNYQGVLEEIVAAQVSANTLLEALMRAAIDVAVDAQVATGSLLGALTDPPKYEEKANRTRERRKSAPRLGVNWLEIEAHKRSIGDAGELWAMRFEEERLLDAGKPKLANRIEHLSREQGDGLGYDILSFDTNGKERLIEVKTTKFGKFTPFFASRNEVLTSAEQHDHYHLYRLFSFGKSPGLYMLSGSLMESCLLEPTAYQARVL